MVTIDDAPWFVAADVCKALGLANVSAALSNLTNGEVRNMHLANGRARPNKIITEAGTYDLVFHSRKREALAFRDWVTGTVLPAIRKDGVSAPYPPPLHPPPRNLPMTTSKRPRQTPQAAPRDDAEDFPGVIFVTACGSFRVIYSRTFGGFPAWRLQQAPHRRSVKSATGWGHIVSARRRDGLLLSLQKCEVTDPDLLAFVEGLPEMAT